MFALIYDAMPFNEFASQYNLRRNSRQSSSLNTMLLEWNELQGYQIAPLTIEIEF